MLILLAITSPPRPVSLGVRRVEDSPDRAFSWLAAGLEDIPDHARPLLLEEACQQPVETSFSIVPTVETAFGPASWHRGENITLRDAQDQSR